MITKSEPTDAEVQQVSNLPVESLIGMRVRLHALGLDDSHAHETFRRGLALASVTDRRRIIAYASEMLEQQELRLRKEGLDWLLRTDDCASVELLRGMLDDQSDQFNEYAHVAISEWLMECALPIVDVVSVKSALLGHNQHRGNSSPADGL